MTNQPFFNQNRVTQFFLYFSGAIALVTLSGWGLSHYGIKIDWSLLVPLGGAIGALIPGLTGIVRWINSRLKENDERIDKLEILAAANRQTGEESARDRHELRKIILKLEARIESIRDERVGSQMGEISEMLRELLERK